LPLSVDSQIVRKADFKISDDGSLEGKVAVTYTGLEEPPPAGSLGGIRTPRPARNISRMSFKDYVPASIDVELKNQPDWESSEKPLVAEYEVKIPGWVSSAGRRALMARGNLVCSTEKAHVRTC